MPISPLDIIFAVVILVSAIRVAIKGFVDEFSAMAAFILGILGAVLLLKQGTLIVDSWGVHGVPAAVLAFVGIFILVFIAIKLVVGFLGTFFETVHLESLNHALGLLLGLAEGCLWVSVILIILVVQPFYNVKGLLDGSVAARVVLPLIDVNSITKALSGKK